MMDVNEAIKELEKMKQSAIAAIDISSKMGAREALMFNLGRKELAEVCIYALRAQQADWKNDPMTLDELRDTDHVHAAGACYRKECKHWHEGTGFCNKNSYFVDAAGDCCDPAKSREWTIFDADDFCSKAEWMEENNAKTD